MFGMLGRLLLPVVFSAVLVNATFGSDSAHETRRLGWDGMAGAGVTFCLSSGDRDCSDDDTETSPSFGLLGSIGLRRRNQPGGLDTRIRLAFRSVHHPMLGQSTHERKIYLVDLSR